MENGVLYVMISGEMKKHRLSVDSLDSLLKVINES